MLLRGGTDAVELKGSQDPDWKPRLSRHQDAKSVCGEPAILMCGWGGAAFVMPM